MGKTKRGGSGNHFLRPTISPRSPNLNGFIDQDSLWEDATPRIPSSELLPDLDNINQEEEEEVEEKEEEEEMEQKSEKETGKEGINEDVS